MRKELGALIILSLAVRAQNVGIGTATPNALLHVKAKSGYTQPLFKVDSANTVKFIIDNTGNVGVGTPSPAHRLDVAGSGRFSGPLTIGVYTLPAVDGTAGQVLVTDGTGNVSWQNVSSAGGDNWGSQVAVTQPPIIGDGTSGAPITLQSGTNAGDVLIYDGTSWQITGAPWTSTCTTIGTDYVTKWTGTDLCNSLIYDNGTNVGIGTNAPTATLDINGTLRVRTINTATTPLTTSSALLVSNSTGDVQKIAFTGNNSDVLRGDGTWGPVSSGGGSADADWYDVSTNTAPTSINANIYTNGRVGIGTSSPASSLHIYENNSFNNTIAFLSVLEKQTTVTPQYGIGVGQKFILETSSGVNEAGRIYYGWQNNSSSSLLDEIYFAIGVYQPGGTNYAEPIRIYNDGLDYGVGISYEVPSWAWPDNNFPTASLEVRGKQHNAAIHVSAYTGSASTSVSLPARLWIRSARGTPASPSYVQTGDELGSLGFGMAGSYIGTSIVGVTPCNWNSTTTCGELEFYTTHTPTFGSGRKLMMKLHATGELALFTDGAEGGQLKLYKHTNSPGPSTEYVYVDYIPVATSIGGFRVVFGPGSNTKCSGAECEIFRVEGDGDLFAPHLNTGTGTTLVVDPTGRVLKSSSSAKYKTNIQPLDDNWSKILSLQPKKYTYKHTGQEAIGYIAEELDSLSLKWLVGYDLTGKPDFIYYDRLPIYLIEIIKQQQKQLATQSQQIKALQERLSYLEQLLDNINNQTTESSK
ncbi:MAG: tail fiber domain-containing protein [Chlorobi bacterium]|nr:tail fiber domain-containing protein [Chlorobiota bacterium]